MYNEYPYAFIIQGIFMKRKLLLTLTAVLLLTGCSSKVSSESVENSLSSTVSEETTLSGSTAPKAQDENKSDNQENTNLDYEKLFQKNPESVMRDSPVGYEDVEYSSSQFQNLNQFPFDVSEFSEVKATMYIIPEDNGNKIPQLLLVTLQNEEAGKILHISIAEERCIRFRYALDEKNAVNRKGIDVFGFEIISDDETNLILYFKKDGKGYTLNTTGMGYEETVKVLDEMLEGKISFDIFNLDKATKVDKGNEMTFEEYFTMNPIDAQFVLDEKTAVTTLDMAELRSEYAEIWKSEIEWVYTQLVALDEKYNDNLTEWHTKSDSIVQQAIDAIPDSGGSVDRINVADASMQVYRDKAKELYEILYGYNGEYTYKYNNENAN